MKALRLTVLQKMMLADASRDGTYHCTSDEMRTARSLERKGLGSVWHDVFEITKAGRQWLDKES